MLKKLVFVGAVLLIASASFATTPKGKYTDGIYAWDVEEWDGNANIKAESWNWPAEYKYLDVCVIPVKMDIGFWVRIKGCKDCEIRLKQNEIRKYSGELTLTVQCNVPIDLKARFDKLSGLQASFNTDFAKVTPSHLDPTGGDIVVSVGIKDVDMGAWAGDVVGTKIQVGNVTISVRPSVDPKLAGV
jgi:hypothetical protein